ncbi:MAG: mechanosensitive ion channel family protein [Patescibacteria group bacterium]
MDMKDIIIENAPSSLAFVVGGNTIREYLIAFAVLVVGMVVLKIFQSVLLDKLKKASEKTKTDLDDVFIKILKDIKPTFYVLFAFYIAIQFLTIPAVFGQVIQGVFLFVIIFQVIRALQTLIDYGADKIIGQTDDEGNTRNKSAIKNISAVLKICLWILAGLIILSNLGFNISSLIAGLGIGGIAVAFALQNVLTDIFSSFSIFLDKPFKEGDFIIVGNDMGVVEKIGIKTTRLKTLQGEELVVSNNELTSARVRNFKKLEKRRVVSVLGICYETDSEKLKAIPSIIKNIINATNLTEFDRCHFKEYGDFSLNFEIVYYVNSADYAQYMDAQQTINFKIKEDFEKRDIEFAYPTQTLYIQKTEKN